ncbi:hypothetical protein GALMADRAFT_225691 [Galerina marginata CBS 339.88]|uniref:Uncharacterized protein n=1 Tax=Galerina marginata (strain CBS 339.88) TaxID=685588 RepID=A0A067TCU9_GALM3|nr:hypothetical protein GALMADRAFT_225691 [Galerina marginata CBS 339.88]
MGWSRQLNHDALCPRVALYFCDLTLVLAFTTHGVAGTGTAIITITIRTRRNQQEDANGGAGAGAGWTFRLVAPDIQHSKMMLGEHGCTPDAKGEGELDVLDQNFCIPSLTVGTWLGRGEERQTNGCVDAI